MTHKPVRFIALSLLSAALAVAQAAQPVPQAKPIENGAQHTLEDGTPVKLRLTNTLSSGSAIAGQEISFEVVDDIEVDGVTVLRAGATATGVVVDAKAKRRLGRAGDLQFNITSVPLADGENAPLRSVHNSKGESHTVQMVELALNMPMASAPFFLLMKGRDTTFVKGTEITAFIDGDLHLDLGKFAR